MKPLYIIKNDTAQLHISKGNSKIGKGIWSFSTLPGNKDHMLILNSTTLLTDIPGTCSKYCEGCFDKGCYAVNSAKLHHNAVIQAWAENTILLRSGSLFEKIDEFITKKNLRFYKTKKEKDIQVKTFRINVSGEIESPEEFEEWNALAEKHKETIFSVYTKNFDALEVFMDRRIRFVNSFMGHGKEVVERNFVINISQWHHVADKFLEKFPEGFNVFEFDDTNRKSCTLPDEDKKRLSETIHCPAVTKSGKHAKDKDGKSMTCDRCMRCYQKHGRTTAVYAH